MVKQQPEALRLADALEDDLTGYDGLSIPGFCQNIANEAAVELRRLEEENLRLREDKNYLLQKAGENVAEIAELQAENNNLRETLTDYEECSKSLTLEKHELQGQLKSALNFVEFTLDRAQNFCDEYLENEAREFIKTIKRN